MQSQELSIYADEKATIEEIQDLRRIDKEALTSLVVNHSNLSNLKGLQSFPNLLNLNLSSNRIASLSLYLQSLVELKCLNASCNELSSLNGIEFLTSLEELEVSHNKISNIQALDSLAKKNSLVLKVVKIKDNLISDIPQVYCFLGFRSLYELELCDEEFLNPICLDEEYVKVLKASKSLRVLNQVDLNEKDLSRINHNHLQANQDLVLAAKEEQKDPNQAEQPHYPNSHQSPYPNPHSFQPYSTGPYNQHPHPHQSLQDIKYKNFLKTQKQSNSNIGSKTLSYLREENRNLQLNIEELFKDQKELIFKFEESENKHRTKIEEIQRKANLSIDRSSRLEAKLEESELQIRELRNRVDLKQRKLDASAKNLEELKVENSALGSKLLISRSDMEFSNAERQKLEARLAELNREVNESKSLANGLKMDFAKEEAYLKGVIEKKSHACKELLERTSEQEQRVYALNKELVEKQSELEFVIQKNSSLQAALAKLNKSKQELEENSNQQINLIKEELLRRHKDELEALDRKFQEYLKEKDDEFYKDLNTLEKNFEESLDKQKEKLAFVSKEKERLSGQYEDCKALLKEALLSAEKLEKQLTERQKELNKARSDYEQASSKFDSEREQNQTRLKAMETELQDLIKENLSLDSVIKQLKLTKTELSDESADLFKENQNLKKEIVILNVESDKLKNQIKAIEEELFNEKARQAKDPHLETIQELENTIKTKDLLLEDQASQIIGLKAELAGAREEALRSESKIEKVKSKYEKRIEALQTEINEFRNFLEEHKSATAEIEETNQFLRLEVDSLKKVIDDRDLELKAKEGILESMRCEFKELRDFCEKANSKAKEKEKEAMRLEGIVQELNESLVQSDAEAKKKDLLLQDFKRSSEAEISSLRSKNAEVLKDMELVLEEYERQKVQFKNNIRNLSSMFS